MSERRAVALQQPTAAPPHDPSHECPAPRRKLVLVVAVLASALGFIDSTVVSIAIPAIRESLGASLAEAQWFHNAYLLALSSLILIGGAAGDRFGVRNTFMAGLVAFAATSVLCALAWSPVVLIVARLLQGVAAAFTVPLSLALIAKNYPAESRGRAIGIWAAASGVTTALGPLLGGWLLTAGGPEAWRIVFWLNPPVAALLVWLLLRVPSDSPRWDGESLDWFGGALVAAGLGALAYALTMFGEGEGGGTTRPLAFGVAGLVLIAAFLMWEARAKAPMVELDLFRSRAFSGANALTFLVYFALSGVLFFLPMAMVAGWGLSEAAVGTVFLPFTAVMAALSGPAGSYADRHGPRGPITLGALVVALAFAWLAWFTPTRSLVVAVYPAMLILGVGMGLCVSPLSTAIMGAVPDDHSGEASGINNAVSRLAGLVAVAALGIVVSAVFAAVGAAVGTVTPLGGAVVICKGSVVVLHGCVQVGRLRVGGLQSIANEVIRRVLQVIKSGCPRGAITTRGGGGVNMQNRAKGAPD